MIPHPGDDELSALRGTDFVEAISTGATGLSNSQRGRQTAPICPIWANCAQSLIRSLALAPHDQHSSRRGAVHVIDVSIVMPCLNERRSLRHCISVARRALDLLEAHHAMTGEIIIADNGSTDGSQELAC